jgi:hypothetical protein
MWIQSFKDEKPFNFPTHLVSIFQRKFSWDLLELEDWAHFLESFGKIWIFGISANFNDQIF